MFYMGLLGVLLEVFSNFYFPMQQMDAVVTLLKINEISKKSYQNCPPFVHQVRPWTELIASPRSSARTPNFYETNRTRRAILSRRGNRPGVNK